MADLDLATIASSKRLVVIASTWGEGDPPARAARGYAELMNDPTLRLEGIEYGVLALGDTAYVEFCAIGKAIDERLAALGARRVVERIDCDLDFAEPAAKWIGEAVKALAPPEPARGTVIAVDFGTKQASAGAVELGPVEAEITEHINLNSSRSDKETVHIELAFEGAAPAYKPGDSLDVFPENDPAYVEALLKSAGLASDDALRTEFTKPGYRRSHSRHWRATPR
jgi:sulfite reductase (NADPH) flavoprotein alpha-component